MDLVGKIQRLRSRDKKSGREIARMTGLSRNTHRALKAARTIADLAGAHATQVTHVAEAMQYRRALS